ncbi:hypothetical protein V8E51_001191, partial [Hyaloscypha variabilis]
TTKRTHMFGEPFELVLDRNLYATIEYRFGSKADLQEATKISFSLLDEIRRARQDSAIVVLNFRALQALRIDEMQEELLELSKEKVDLLQQIKTGGKAESSFKERRAHLNGRIDELLHKYALALRDYETLSQEAVAELVPKTQNLKWHVTTGLEKGWKILTKVRHYRPYSDPEMNARGKNMEDIEFDPESKEHYRRTGLFNPEPTLEDLFKQKNAKNNFRELDKAAREARDKHKASSERLWMGSFGGLALIVPMLIMVLHRSVHGSLIVTSVGTVLFAVALALAARSLKGMDVLAATAAYAAVLVVFVGSSLPPVA